MNDQTILDQMKQAYVRLGEALESKNRVDIPIQELADLLETAKLTGLV